MDPSGEDPEDADDFPETNPRRFYRKLFNQGARQLTSAPRFQPGSPERGAYAWVMQVITGPVGVVYGAVSGVTGSDPLAGARLSGGQRFLAVATAGMAVVGKAAGLGCAKQPVPASINLLWRVGSYNELRALVPKGSDLQVHHLPSRVPGLHRIQTYSYDEGLAVTLPRDVHQARPSTSRLQRNMVAGLGVREHRKLLSAHLRDLNGALPQDVRLGVMRQIGQELRYRYPDFYR